MRHAGGGVPDILLARAATMRWRGWSGPVRRTRQAASLALVGAILTLGGASTRASTAPAPGTLALPDRTSTAEAGGAVRPIDGWTGFCRRMPAECAFAPDEAAMITLTHAVWRTLQSVNHRVNARIMPLTDQAHWGIVDRWDFPDDGFGDCEDYQLLKRRMLAERGLPRRALLMTVVIDEIDAGHAVLTVRTDRGDFILDNKTDAIRAWKTTGYSFIKRAGQDGPAWVSLVEDGGGTGKPRGAQVADADP